MTKKQTKMSKEIMENIDEVQMHSKVYFVMLRLALVGVTGLTMILSALTFIVIARDVRYGETLGLRGGGGLGYNKYALTLPWLAILFGLLTFLIMYVLVKRFKFGYKQKLYTLLGASLFAIAGLSLLFAGTGTDKLFTATIPFKNLHTISRYADTHTVSGEVVYVGDDYLVLLSDQGKKIEIYFDEDLKGPTANYEIGQIIFAVGEYQDEDDGVTFEAYSIKFGRRPTPPHIKGMFQRILK